MKKQARKIETDRKLIRAIREILEIPPNLPDEYILLIINAMKSCLSSKKILEVLKNIILLNTKFSEV